MKIKKGFTLAEVLITMTIIGVVAAITIPVLENHYMEQVTVSKVKKFVSTFSNALRLAISEYGSITTWDLESETDADVVDSVSSEKLFKYIKPYLNIMIDCGTSTSSRCSNDIMYKTLDGRDVAIPAKNSQYYRFILSDSSVVWLRSNGNECINPNDTGGCAYIFFDINGDKKTNRFGKDTFVLNYNEYGIHFFTGSEETECSYSSTSPTNGYLCLQHIMKYSNMDYNK